jgi:hypothetical protein
MRVAFPSASLVPAPSSSVTSQISSDGVFTIEGVIPGSYRATVSLPQSVDTTWTAKSAMLGERDLLDGPVGSRRVTASRSW